MAKHKTAWKFQYIGPGDVTTGLDKIVRDGKPADDQGVLIPGDVVVVDDPDLRDYLRSLTNFQEQESPTSDHRTHKAAPKKPPAKKPAAASKKKAPASGG